MRHDKIIRYKLDISRIDTGYIPDAGDADNKDDHDSVIDTVKKCPYLIRSDPENSKANPIYPKELECFLNRVALGIFNKMLVLYF